MNPNDIPTIAAIEELLDRQLGNVRKLLEGGPREAMLTIPEAAHELQIGRKTVERLINDGELLASRVGRQWRIRRRDLDRYLRANSNREAG